MLKDMSEEYPEVKFLEEIGYAKFKVLETFDNIKLDNEITLEKEDSSQLKFKIVDIYENEIIIVPVLPLLGFGGRVFTELSIENGNAYLKNILSK